MSDQTPLPERPHSSRRRYHAFVRDYKRGKLDDAEGTETSERAEGAVAQGEAKPSPDAKPKSRGKRREYLREYLRWLRPHRYVLGGLLLVAVVGAGLEMVEPLFMRF